MRFSIEEIKQWIRDRYKYYINISQDLKSIQQGTIDALEAKDILGYLAKLTHSKVPQNEIEKTLYIEALKELSDDNAYDYLELLKCFRCADEEVGIMGAYVSLQAIVEKLNSQPPETLSLHDKDQLKLIRASLLRYLPSNAKLVSEAVSYSYDKALKSVHVRLSLSHYAPEMIAYGKKFGHLITDKKIMAKIPVTCLQPLAEMFQKIKTLEAKEPPNLAQNQTQYILFKLAQMRVNIENMFKFKQMVWDLSRRASDIQEQERLSTEIVRWLERVEQEPLAYLQIFSSLLIVLNANQKILEQVDFDEKFKKIESAILQCQVMRVQYRSDLVEVMSFERLAILTAAIEIDFEALEGVRRELETYNLLSSRKIEAEKALRRAHFEMKQAQKEQLERALNLQEFEAFKRIQAEKISARKAELLLQQAVKKIERLSIFQPAPLVPSSIIPAPVMGVNVEMMRQLMALRDEYVELIISILKGQGKIYYSDIEYLIINQLDGDILSHGGSHRTIVLGMLYTPMFVNEQNEFLPQAEVVRGGVARPHAPGHGEIPMSKFNIKLVSQTLMNAGITLDVIEDIMVRRARESTPIPQALGL